MSGFCSSGLLCSTAMFTTAGVTFSRIGANVGNPSRSGAPEGICAAAPDAMNARTGKTGRSFITTALSDSA